MVLCINCVLDQGFSQFLGFTQGQLIGKEKVNAPKTRIREVIDDAHFDFFSFAEELLDEEVFEDFVVAEVPEGTGVWRFGSCVFSTGASDDHFGFFHDL